VQGPNTTGVVPHGGRTLNVKGSRTGARIRETEEFAKMPPGNMWDNEPGSFWGTTSQPVAQSLPGVQVPFIGGGKSSMTTGGTGGESYEVGTIMTPKIN